KSTSAANLAVTLSHQGVATLLIDGDLRRGTLHEIFGVDRTPGLAEVLREEVELGEALRSIELAGGRLDILPSGAHPENPSELIGGQRMELVLQDLIDRYDRILIDTPPLRSATDAAVLCSMPYTGALMVARAGFSDRHAIEEVARELQEMGIRVDGVIINDVAVSERPAYGYHSVYAD
ncbi:MAG: tyrosine-protein kinase family protein, partial [Longimicrobiales bacterium]